MECLNDDCLIHILTLLNLKNQLNCLKVNRRFKALMPFVWRKQYKTFSMHLYELKFDDDEFEYFIKSISGIVRVIKLKMLTMNQFVLLMEQSFPNVTEFRFSQRPPLFMDDVDISLMHTAMPNLCIFSPHGAFTGAHIDLWPNITELALSYCYKLTITNFRKIMQTHQLKILRLSVFDRNQITQIDLQPNMVCNLETITVNSDELKWIEPLLQHMIHLREIVVTNAGNDTLEQLCLNLRRANPNIAMLETCNNSNVLNTVLRSNLKIKKVAIVADDMPLVYIGEIHFERYSWLRELHIHVCRIEESMSVTRLLTSIPKVELLSLVECDCGFAEYVIEVDTIVHGRTKKLTLNLFNNTYKNENREDVNIDWITIGSSPLLEIKHQAINKLSFEPIRILFD